MYATDYEGDYPPALDYLTDDTQPGGKYMKTIPDCPNGKIKGSFLHIFVYGPQDAPYMYEMADHPDNFTLWCSIPNSHRD